jgi:hypothetical protein
MEVTAWDMIDQLALMRNLDSSVGIVMGYGPAWPTLNSKKGKKIFSLLHGVHTGSGTQLPSYPMGIGGSFPGDKTVGARSWQLISY